MAVRPFSCGKLVPDGIGEAYWTAWTPFSYPVNLTQQPAMSVNCGFSASGLPIGLQFVGPMHRDDLVLRAAASPRRSLRRRSPRCWKCCGSTRSEEHTSELQSLMRISYAVFCLKQKKHIFTYT